MSIALPLRAIELYFFGNSDLKGSLPENSNKLGKSTRRRSRLEAKEEVSFALTGVLFFIGTSFLGETSVLGETSFVGTSFLVFFKADLSGVGVGLVAFSASFSAGLLIVTLFDVSARANSVRDRFGISASLGSAFALRLF